MCTDLIPQIKIHIEDSLTRLGISIKDDDFNRFWVACYLSLCAKYVSPEINPKFKNFSSQPAVRDQLEKFLTDEADLFLIQEYFITPMVSKHFSKYVDPEFNICKNYVYEKLTKKLIDDEFFIKDKCGTFITNQDVRNRLNTYLGQQISLYKEEQFNLLQGKGRYEDIIYKLHYECLDFQEFLYHRLRKMKLPSSYKLVFTTGSSGTKFQKEACLVPIQIDLVKHKNFKKPDKKKHHAILNKVRTEINKYQTVQDLRNQVRLDNAVNAHYKFMAFDKLFHDNKTQDNLKTYFDSFVWRFIKNIGHILTAGLVSRYITKGTFRFWKTTEELFIERMNSHSQKNADFKSRMHADVEPDRPSIAIVLDKPNPAENESVSVPSLSIMSP